MSIYYIDPSGSAGTGDGTSFANRAQYVQSLDLGSSGRYLPDGEHEVRYIKNPDPHTLANCSTKRTAASFRSGYSLNGISTSSDYYDWSTTKGASQFKYSNHALKTGDWIEISWCKIYYTSTSDGDGSGSNQVGNYVPLNGLWRITVVDDDWFKLDQFTAPVAKATNVSFSTVNLSCSSAPRWISASSQVLEFSSALPIKPIASYERDRKKWTASSNVTTYDPIYEQSSWSNNNQLTQPPGADRIATSSSFTTGKVAYYELSATLDLSAFQGVSYELGWLNGNRYTKDDTTGHGKFSIRLCTDTTGDTSAHTIPIDTRFIDQNQRRGGCNHDTSGNMNSAIKSIAVYLDDRGSDTGSFDFALTNIIAYKTATPLHHRSQLSFKTTDDPQYYVPQYFVEDGDTHAIKLGCSHKYYHQMYSEMGYYGTNGLWWSQNYTNQNLYVVEPFYFGRHNSTVYQSQNNGNYNWTDTESRGDEFYPFNLNMYAFGSGVLTNNAVTGWKEVSGGWNRTDMSSRANDNDLTQFDNGWGGNYQGFWTSSSGAQCQYFHHFGTCRGAGWHTESPFTKCEKMFHHLYSYGKFYSNHVQGIKDVWFTQGPESGYALIDRNTQDYASNTASDFKLHYHGHDGQSQRYIYNFSGTWDYLNTEMSYFGFQMNQFNGNGPVTINNWYTGLWGRQSSGGDISQGYNDITIGNLYVKFNQIQLQNSVKVTLNNFEYKITDPLLANNNTGYPYYTVSNNNPSYSLYVNTPTAKILGGSTEKRFNIYQPLKLNNFVSTDSQEHNISGANTTLASANHNGVSGTGKFFGYKWTMEPETTIKRGNSGQSWKITKTANDGIAKHTIGKVAVAGSGTVTVKIWMYRTNSGTSVYGKLIIPADATLGLSTDSEANNTSGSADTWEEITVTASPSSAGIMDIQIETQTDTGTSAGSVYFDDLTVEQS